MKDKQKLKKTMVLLFENAIRFLCTLIFIMGYSALFGAENTLAGVAISVGLTMFPVCDLGVKPSRMAAIIVALFLGCGMVAQLALVSPWLALPINLMFVMLIMLLTCEPMVIKPSIIFLLTFVFCQATPVPAELFKRRLVGLAVGSVAVALATVILWRKKGYGRNGHGIVQQMRLCSQNPGLVLRMSIGIAAAMFIGMEFNLKKPLWLSIVVMSLTQPQYHETVERIKHRFFGTLVGVAVFVVVFIVLVPQQYAMILILLMGYLSFFTPEYKHKQVINAVSAINASLVLLDPSTAILNRLLCLLGGVGIVLALHLLEHPIILMRAHFSKGLRNRPERDDGAQIN